MAARMCRMMGVVSRGPVYYDLFEEFADLATEGMCPIGAPDERGHKDGWGLACFQDGALTVFFFSSRRRHTRLQGDWIQTCALPISATPRWPPWGPWSRGCEPSLFASQASTWSPKDTDRVERGQAEPPVHTAVTRFAPIQYATSRQSDTSHHTRSARSPGAIWPPSPASPSAAAAFTLTANSAPACRKPGCDPPSALTGGRPPGGADPRR